MPMTNIIMATGRKLSSCLKILILIADSTPKFIAMPDVSRRRPLRCHIEEMLFDIYPMAGSAVLLQMLPQKRHYLIAVVIDPRFYA